MRTLAHANSILHFQFSISHCAFCILHSAFCIVAFAASGADATIGVATSMETIRPRSGYAVRPASEARIRLARGEYESLQILVAPTERDLKGVKVAVNGDLSPMQNAECTMQNEKGHRLPTAGNRLAAGEPPAPRQLPHSPTPPLPHFAATNVAACVVGYVLTTNVPPYKVRPTKKPPKTGWWADPILDFQKEADVAKGDVQSFWVRVHCPDNQPAGEYEGSLAVLAEGETPVRLPLRVRVNDFTLPREPPLPLAISCERPRLSPNVLPKEGRDEQARRIRESDGYQAWKTNETAYCDFFAEYFISWGAHLYLGAGREPNWTMLSRLKEKGRLCHFNLYYFLEFGEASGAEEKWRADVLPAMRARYEKAKSLGLADKALLYGSDERNPETFTNIARTVSAIHESLPDVPVLTTARDKKLGSDGSLLKDVDIFCPIISRYKAPQVEKARAEGRKVWWYICCDPGYPWPNAFVECPPIEMRSLMGAMTQKFKPDGFLYWATVTWPDGKPIAKGPFTEWQPRSYGKYHGDGQWVCFGGPGTMPLPTLRLENFRDGLEDLWYAKLLEQKLQKLMQNAECRMQNNAGGSQSPSTDASATDCNRQPAAENRLAAGEPPAPRQLNPLTAQPLNRASWAQRAREALAVPREVVDSVRNFTDDPAVLYRWRDEMADLIESAP